jgi:hypothetical protein
LTEPWAKQLGIYIGRCAIYIQMIEQIVEFGAELQLHPLPQQWNILE